MTFVRRLAGTLHALLVALAVFLGLTAAAGGVMLLMGVYAPPVEQLQGSAFSDFTIPGAFLLIVVGGSATCAALMLARKHILALPAAGLAGAIIMCFEFVQVIVIGSPPGAPRVMQVLYFGVGLTLVLGSLAAMFIDGTGEGPRT